MSSIRGARRNGANSGIAHGRKTPPQAVTAARPRKIKVPGANRFTPVDVDLLLDYGSEFMAISGELVGRIQKERPDIELRCTFEGRARVITVFGQQRELETQSTTVASDRGVSMGEYPVYRAMWGSPGSRKYWSSLGS